VSKPAFHASMLSTLSKCGLQAQYRYVDGIKSPPGVAMIVGTAVHKSAHADLSAKLSTGALLQDAEIKQAASDAFDATWAGEEPMLDDDEKELGADLTKGHAKDTAVALSALHHRELAPRLAPIAVERKMRLVLDGVPFDIEGTIDVEEADTVRDLKTASKSPSDDAAVGMPQLEIYSMLRTTIDKTPTKNTALDFLVKNKAPKVVSVTAPAPKSFTPILRRVEMAAKVFETGAFYPVDPSGPSAWVCSKRFCGYFDMCPLGAARKVQG
jgi:hypothetical protein